MHGMTDRPAPQGQLPEFAADDVLAAGVLAGAGIRRPERPQRVAVGSSAVNGSGSRGSFGGRHHAVSAGESDGPGQGLHVFCGDRLLAAYLRPGKSDGARHTWAILALLTKRLRQARRKVKIVFRSVNGLCRRRMLSWCERKGMDYIVGIARNAALAPTRRSPSWNWRRRRTRQRLCRHDSAAISENRCRRAAQYPVGTVAAVQFVFPTGAVPYRRGPAQSRIKALRSESASRVGRARGSTRPEPAERYDSSRKRRENTPELTQYAPVAAVSDYLGGRWREKTNMRRPIRRPYAISRLTSTTTLSTL